jgi:hypothetical protein
MRSSPYDPRRVHVHTFISSFVTTRTSFCLYFEKNVDDQESRNVAWPRINIVSFQQLVGSTSVRLLALLNIHYGGGGLFVPSFLLYFVISTNVTPNLNKDLGMCTRRFNVKDFAFCADSLLCVFDYYPA